MNDKKLPYQLIDIVFIRSVTDCGCDAKSAANLGGIHAWIETFTGPQQKQCLVSVLFPRHEKQIHEIHKKVTH